MPLFRVLGWSAVLLFVACLWLGGTLLVRRSDEYRLALATGRERYPELSRGEMSLCLTCANSMTVGSGQRRFRIAIVVRQQGQDAIVCVAGRRRVGDYAYDVASGPGRCAGTGPRSSSERTTVPGVPWLR